MTDRRPAQANSSSSPPPRVGLAVGRLVDEDGRVIDGTPHGYSSAVTTAGGLPLLLPRLSPELAPAAVATIDALLLTGGGDVDPAHYGAAAEPETAEVDPDRDAAEIALVAAALARHLPVLGICRGSQVLNVALGGTLHQHLARLTPLDHNQWDDRHLAVHEVEVAPDSQLAALTGSTSFKVNSVHHQGLAELGSGLTAVAWSEDGVVEAVEDRSRNLLAVQWHPELFLEAGPTQGLFAWLVEQGKSKALV